MFESPTYGAPVGYRFSRPSPSNAKRERHAPDLLLRNRIGNGLGKRGVKVRSKWTVCDFIVLCREWGKDTVVSTFFFFF